MKNPHAVALGSIITPAKSRAAKENGLLGGRPRLKHGHNTRHTRLIEYKGQKMGLNAWAKKLGLNKESLRIRLEKMSVDSAFTLPAKSDHRRKTTQLNEI